MVFTGIPQISTLRKNRFFSVINFLPLNQCAGRSSHDDRSHHHHPPAIHHVIMIMFCIIRHNTEAQASLLSEDTNQTSDPCRWCKRADIRCYNQRLNQFSAHRRRSSIRIQWKRSRSGCLTRAQICCSSQRARIPGWSTGIMTYYGTSMSSLIRKLQKKACPMLTKMSWLWP